MLGLEIAGKSEGSTSSFIVSPPATLRNLPGASNTSRPVLSFLFFKVFIYLFLGLLGLRRCPQASSSCGEQGFFRFQACAQQWGTG